MRWIAILALLFVMTGSAFAAGSDEQYLDIYNEILQADTLAQGGHSEAAALKYLQAQADLQKLQTDHPSWNPDIVKYRMDYLTEKLQPLQKYLPSTNAAPGVATAPADGSTNAAAPAPVSQPEIAQLQEQNTSYQDQIHNLSAANAELNNKLKEALSVQPAPVSPDELAKAQAKIVTLQKERDLLQVALDQEKASNATALAAAKAAANDQAVADLKARSDAELKKAHDELDAAKAAAAESDRKLAVAMKELDELKAQHAIEVDQQNALKAKVDEDAKRTQETMTQLKEASDESAKIMAAANRELELLRSAHLPEIQPSGDGVKAASTESDQLKQLLTEISKDEAEIARLKQAVADGEQKLADANSQIDSLKAAHPDNATPSDQAKVIISERDKLKEELAQRSKDLADAEAHHSEELLSVRTALQQAEARRDELEKALAAKKPGKAPLETMHLAQRMHELQARVDVLESHPVPYTEEELAMMKQSPATNLAPDATPATVPTTNLAVAMTEPAATTITNAGGTRHVHSFHDLPAGSGPLWEDGMRASMNGDFHTAEDKFKSVLKMDPTNVYVLAFLANTQFAAGQLDECEKSVQRALASDPEDPGSLYLLGLLRYRQNKLDEALDALSMSAKINPTNAATQNFLGCVLADKGLRTQAETAMRKALQCDPDYADAHFNLAVVYAGNQPPSLQLAGYHYRKALALGHSPSPTLEKLLEDANKTSPSTQ